MPQISSIDQRLDGLNLTWSSGADEFFSYLWLRDHARDARNFDAQTHQRLFSVADLAVDLVPVLVEFDQNQLRILWPGSSTKAEYGVTLLSARSKVNQTLASQKLWNTIEPCKFDFASATGAQFSEMLSALKRDGVILLTDCERSESTVRSVAEKIGYVRETIYGAVWQFEANQAMADSAYSTDELRPHTDGTYSLDAPGLQLLLCLAQGAEGGESILVDGFAIAEAMRSEQPELFEMLSTVEVTGIYKGDGKIIRASRPAICQDSSGCLQQVSFNSYDRDILNVDQEHEKKFYEAMIEFEKRANHPDWQWCYKLEEGQMLVFDNWRLLHGRKAFTGYRKFAGCYVNREDFLSACLTNL